MSTKEAALRTSPDWRRINNLYLALRLEDLKERLQRAARGEDSGPQTDVMSRLSALHDEADMIGPAPALEILSRMFRLSVLEQDLFLMSAAPDLDDSFAAIFASGRESGCRRATLALGLALHQRGNRDAAGLSDCLLPGRALRRFALIRSIGSPDHNPWSLTAPLYCDERMAAYVRGANIRENRLAQIVRPLSGGIEAPGHLNAINEIAHSLSPEGGEWPVVRIAAACRADAREAALAAAKRLSITLMSLNIVELAAHRSEWDELLALLSRESALNGIAYWIGGDAEPDGTDPAARDCEQRLLEELEAPVLAVATKSLPPNTASRTVTLPRLDRRAQKSVWEAALSTIRNSVNGELDRISQQFDLGPFAIRRVVQLATEQAQQRPGSDAYEVSGKNLWDACRQHAAGHLDDLARRIEPCFTWDDIVVPAPTMAQLREIAAQVHHRAQVYETWGFGEKLSRGRGISVLFCGNSGTGKTMAAEVLAHHLELDLHRIDLSGVVNKYIGETEKNLRRVFDAAEMSGAILFFDEADALFGTRTEVRDSHDRYANIEVNYLLQRMEDYSGLAILATNRKQALDQAFLRRLRFVVDFPFPNAEYRRRIWQKSFPEEMEVGNLDFNALARLEVSGGNIRSISLNAAFLAATDESPLTTVHVMRAAAREYAKIERGISANEFGSYAEVVRA